MITVHSIKYSFISVWWNLTCWLINFGFTDILLCHHIIIILQVSCYIGFDNVYFLPRGRFNTMFLLGRFSGRFFTVSRHFICILFFFIGGSLMLVGTGFAICIFHMDMPDSAIHCSINLHAFNNLNITYISF